MELHKGMVGLESVEKLEKAYWKIEPKMDLDKTVEEPMELMKLE